jgi:predicted PhzF superfamily epimerase YddE/YHI9
LEPGADVIRFHTRSGLLTVTRTGDAFALDFPALGITRGPDDADVVTALGAAPVEIWHGMDMMAVFAAEADIRALTPDMAKVARLKTRGVIATAPGEACDFVSRFFAPQSGIPEDPVTGSAHCMLTPYWAKRLSKTRLSARQISKRGGELTVETKGERVLISGRVAPYLDGRIRV